MRSTRPVDIIYTGRAVAKNVQNNITAVVFTLQHARLVLLTNNSIHSQAQTFCRRLLRRETEQSERQERRTCDTESGGAGQGRTLRCLFRRVVDPGKHARLASRENCQSECEHTWRKCLRREGKKQRPANQSTNKRAHSTTGPPATCSRMEFQ